VIAGAIFWFALSSADAEMKRRGNFDDEVVIPPGKEFGYVIVVLLSKPYQFEVRPVDGRAVMGVGRIDDGDSEQMSPSDLSAAMEDASAVEAGAVGVRSGDMTRGRYLWLVVNPSKEKPLRVRIRFG
jgi:hypothetical protein